MTEPTTAYIFLRGALAITLGLLVRGFYTLRVPTIRSVVQAERKQILRICKQTVHESSVLTPDVLERIEMVDARDETGGLGKTGQSQLRAAAQDCIRAQLIKVLFKPTGLSRYGSTRLLADMLDQLQLTSASPLDLDCQSIEREASRRLLQGAINRYISTCNATQTLAMVLDIVRNHTFDYSQLIGIEDEAELTLDSEWT